METDPLAPIIAMIKAGNLSEARQALRQRLQEDPRDERAWLWLAETMPDTTRRIAVLEHALKFHPQGDLLRRSLAHLKIHQFSQAASADEAPAMPGGDRTIPLHGVGAAPHTPAPASIPASEQPSAPITPPVESAQPSEAVTPASEVPPPGLSSAPASEQPPAPITPPEGSPQPPEAVTPASEAPPPGLPSAPRPEPVAAKPYKVGAGTPRQSVPATAPLPEPKKRKPGASPFEKVFLILVGLVILGIIAYVLWQRQIEQQQSTRIEVTRAALLSTQAAQQTELALRSTEPPQATPTPSPSPSATALLIEAATPEPTAQATALPGVFPTPARAAAPWRQAFIGVSVVEGELHAWLNDRPASFLADLGDTTYSAWGISPDGQVILYMHGKDLWGINNDGSGQRPLLSFDQLQALSPLDAGAQRLIAQADWIPATHQLLFTTLASQADGSLAAQDDLYRLDTDTGQASLVFAPGEGGRFLVSPDGTRLALIHSDHLSLALVSGGEKQGPFSWTPLPGGTWDSFFPDVVWEPGGQSLLLALPFTGAALTSSPTDYAVWRVLVQGPEAVQIWSVPVGSGLSHVAFAPDGSLLAFLAPVAGAANATPALHVALSDGKLVAIYPNALPLDEAGGVIAAWSPDAQRLLFRLQTDSGPVYAVAGAGLSPQPVLLEGVPLTGAQASWVGWLDEATLYYHAADTSQVSWLEIDGGATGILMQSEQAPPLIRLLGP